MLYLLEYKYDFIYDDKIKSNARLLDFYYTQEISWANGNFILESIENNTIKTLVAYPHIEPPNQELIFIQEYILDKLNINLTSPFLYKFIYNKNDDTPFETFPPNFLVVKYLNQDFFFNKILSLSIREKSNYIAAIFYKKYFFDGIISKNLDFEYRSNSKFNNLQDSIYQKIRIYFKAETTKLPILIINTQSKNEFQSIRYFIIEEIKKFSNLELHNRIYTPINESSFIKLINQVKSESFLNNLIGQIWDISLDINLFDYNLLNPSLLSYFVSDLVKLKNQSLVIILNQNRLPLMELFPKENIIIVQ